MLLVLKVEEGSHERWVTSRELKMQENGFNPRTSRRNVALHTLCETCVRWLTEVLDDKFVLLLSQQFVIAVI